MEAKLRGLGADIERDGRVTRQSVAAMITLALVQGPHLRRDAAAAGSAPASRCTEDPENSRKLILPTTRPDVRVVLVRATDVPTYVQYGGADLGVAGIDVLLEHGGDGPLPAARPAHRALPHERGGARRLRLRHRGASRARASASRPSTSTVAREHFADKGVHVDLIKLYGSMELAPLTGLADAIVDLVSTGSTLKANHLVEVEQIMDISSRLVVNQAALKLKREPLRPLIDAFEAAVERRP